MWKTKIRNKSLEDDYNANSNKGAYACIEQNH
jgi:hypothetical protein